MQYIITLAIIAGFIAGALFTLANAELALSMKNWTKSKALLLWAKITKKKQ